MTGFKKLSSAGGAQFRTLAALSIALLGVVLLAAQAPTGGAQGSGRPAASAACADDTWTPTGTANAPSAVMSPSAVWTGKEMIVWGGGVITANYGVSDVVNAGRRYNPETDTWTPTGTADAPSPRFRHTAVWTGKEMIVWGGSMFPNPHFIPFASGGRYNPATDTWTPISTANAPSPRYGHTAVWTGTEMIVWGGSDWPAPIWSNTGGRYDLMTDTWTPTSTANAPSPRYLHTAVWTGKEMIVKNGPDELNAKIWEASYSGGRYNPDSDTWSPTSTVNAPGGGAENTAVWTGKEMIVWGGSGGRYCAASENQADHTDFFVSQHYRDFLNREPDAAGLHFWMNEIDSCGTDRQCLEVKRVNVSAAFFLSIEHQQTGYLVYRTYGAAFGATGVGSTVPLTLQEFLPDSQRISRGVVVGRAGWEQQLEANKAAYFDEFAARPRFLALYPQAMTARAFVDALDRKAGGVLTRAERDDLVDKLSAGQFTRAEALRAVAENYAFSAREFNRAFVLMQYFEYLRRNPYDAPEPGADFAGYNFWLTKLDAFDGDFVRAEMVKAFISSDEYRKRFGQ